MSSVYGMSPLVQVNERIEKLKKTHRDSLVSNNSIPEDSDYVEGIKTRSWGDLVTDIRHEAAIEIADKLLNVVPEPEPDVVNRFRALILSLDTMNQASDEALRSFGEIPIEFDEYGRAMQNVAINYREEARDLIEDRLVLETPTDDDDADVIYIYDPVSKLRRTTALGGYKKEYDEANIKDQRERLAEEILYYPLPDTVPRV